MAFDIKNFFNEESIRQIKSDWKPVLISVHKLRPADDKKNFYHLDDKEVEETARSIELVGLQQYPVVRPIDGTDQYEIMAGHKRRLAILKLVKEGKTEYEMIPCRVESSDDGIKNELILIFTNSTQRSRTDYEKMQEIGRVRELLEEYQKKNGLTGRKQNIIADILGTSKTKVGTLENIDRKLISTFKDEFAGGKISTSVANEIAGLEEDKQRDIYETYRENGGVIAKEIKEMKQPGEVSLKEAQYSEEDDDTGTTGGAQEPDAWKEAKEKRYDAGVLGDMIKQEEEELALMAEHWKQNQPYYYVKHVMALDAYKALLAGHRGKERHRAGQVPVTQLELSQEGDMI